MNLKQRLAKLEAEQTARPPRTSFTGLTPLPADLSRMNARELYDLAVSGGMKVAPFGSEPARGEVVSWEAMEAMSAPELVKLYFAQREP